MLQLIIFFVPYPDSVDLIQLLTPSDGPGFFTGKGIEFRDSQYFWVPQWAGPGKHSIYYSAFGCLDTLELEVETPIVFQIMNCVTAVHQPFCRSNLRVDIGREQDF
jgi:hypothetical protein